MADLVEVVAAVFHLHAGDSLERVCGRARIGVIRRIARVHAHALPCEQPRDRHPALAQSDDRNRAPRTAPGIRNDGKRCDHRTLSVASAIIAHSTPRM